MFSVGCGSYRLLCVDDGLPFMLDEYVARAALVEQFDLASSDGAFCFTALQRADADWPSLVVTQRYSPAGAGFHLGALLVPETNRLFLGAGTRLLCYDVAAPARVWEDVADVGFLSWRLDGEQVFMSAEVELAAFSTAGTKLWTRFVEPPWHFQLASDRIVLDVMGVVTHLDRRTGEPLRP